MVEREYAPGIDAEVYDCARRAAVVWAPTDWAANQFRRAGVRNVRVVPEAVDASLFVPPAVSNKKKRKKKFTILTIGKWEFRKNMPTLLEAVFRYLDADCLLLLHSYVVSWDKISERNLQKVADDAKRQYCHRTQCPTVTWTGDRQLDRVAMLSLYGRADLFVLPTLGEGWGLPIHEAMAVGLPVVATNHSGPAALVADAGILLPSHETEGTKSTYVPGPTPREIADAILYVKNNPDAAKHLAQAAKLRVTTLFSPKIVADIMMNHLEADFPSFPQKAAASSFSSLKTTR